jgi:hypothetical protein
MEFELVGRMCVDVGGDCGSNWDRDEDMEDVAEGERGL